MRISDWSADVCSSDLLLDAEEEPVIVVLERREPRAVAVVRGGEAHPRRDAGVQMLLPPREERGVAMIAQPHRPRVERCTAAKPIPMSGRVAQHHPVERQRRAVEALRSEEHTYELQSLMR